MHLLLLYLVNPIITILVVSLIEFFLSDLIANDFLLIASIYILSIVTSSIIPILSYRSKPASKLYLMGTVLYSGLIAGSVVIIFGVFLFLHLWSSAFKDQPIN